MQNFESTDICLSIKTNKQFLTHIYYRANPQIMHKNMNDSCESEYKQTELS